MSFFSHAQGFKVNGGQFTATTTNNSFYLNDQTGIDILREASALEAIHDSSARSYAPRCFPGTREQYIEDIVNRGSISFGDPSSPVYWMRGPAGVGKSAIAQTCAERLQQMGALGASFFFSVSGQHKPEKLFPSIAYQLSTIHPTYRDLIDGKIRNDKTLISKAIRFQFRHLIDEPFRELEASGKGIRKGIHICVDGLDECEGSDAQCEIIRIVAAATSDGALPLRWVFFSRPEPHIEATFAITDVAPHCHKVFLPISRDADGEIELYLKNAFQNILQHRNPSAQAPWPTVEEMEIIVRGAGGSFIYATTVVRFVGRPDSICPQKRLLAIVDVLLKRCSGADTSNNAPLAELDAFYTLILQRVPLGVFPSVHLLLALMCRFGGLGAMPAANMLGMPKNEFETACHHVSAVVRLEEPDKELVLDPSIDTNSAFAEVSNGAPDKIFRQISRCLGGRVEVYHKSFLDFLLDPSRSGGYCVHASETLAKQIVKIHLDYDRSFRWCGTELILAPGVPDSAASLSFPYTNELVNSILKTLVYALTGDENASGFTAPQEVRVLEANCDFRKWLHTYTKFADISQVFRHRYWGYESQRRYFRGAFVEYISRDKFTKPAVVEFKLMIKWREQAGIIRRYHPSLTSRIKSFFHGKSQGSIESALYLMGHGDKAIFWYWEINHSLQSYREFRSIDLAEGERRFREEAFDSWPAYGHEYRDKGGSVNGGSGAEASETVVTSKPKVVDNRPRLM